MAKKNIISEKMEAVKKWWDSDTTKAISTIIAVLLIPGAVLAWNYASGRNVKVEDSILEGDSTSVEPNVEESQPTEEAVIEENATTSYFRVRDYRYGLSTRMEVGIDYTAGGGGAVVRDIIGGFGFIPFTR